MAFQRNSVTPDPMSPERVSRTVRNPGGRAGADVDPVVVGRARGLLERADLLLDNAVGVEDRPEQFRQFYLAALRAAGVALEIVEPRPTRSTRRRGSSNAWRRIAGVAPELGVHADYFAARSVLRMNIEAGIVRAVEPAVVAEMHRRVLAFLDAVESMLIAYEQGGAPAAGAALAHPA